MTDRRMVRQAMKAGGWALALVLFLLSTRPAAAAPVVVGGGFDYYTGPGDQITRSGLATVGVQLGPTGGLSLTGMRFDDNQAGKGTSLTGGVVVPMLPTLQLRGFGTRYLGDDESFRAWRAKVGPQANLPTGQSLGVFYSHYQDDADVTTDGVIGEFGTPLVPHLAGRANAAYSTASGGVKAGQGAVGLSWTPVHSLELSGEVGVAGRGATVTQSVPSRRGLHLPLIGSDPPPTTTTQQETTAEATVLVGARIWFP